MNNKELIARLANDANYTQSDTQQMVTVIIDRMRESFEAGDSVTVGGFGTFEVKKRMERLVVNPGTGQRMLVPPKLVLGFKPRQSAKTGNKMLAAALEEKCELAREEAEKIVVLLFDTVSAGLADDKLTKVKGLGTFKMISVAPRKSVDVNTGEAIILKERDKTTFTPDATLRDDVNKPFMQFETVVVDDGVDFSDIDQKYSVEEDKVETTDELVAKGHDVEKPVAEEPVVEEPAAEEHIVEEPVVEEPVVDEPAAEDSVVEEPSTEEHDVEEPVVENPATEKHVAEKAIAEKAIAEKSDVVEQTADESAAEETVVETESLIDNGSDNRVNTLKLLIGAAAVVIVLCLAGGYYMFDQIKKRDHRIEHLEAQVNNRKNTPARVAAKPVPQPSVVEKASSQKGENASVDSTRSTKEEKPSEDFASMGKDDARVRTGAYVITGIDRTVTVAPGQTLAGISKANLGPGMECYVEAANGGRKEVKEGDVVRIPKLRIKKKK